LVGAEDPRKPLSDQAIAEELHRKGIQVARRTVAKYREGMRIPSSSERQRAS
jgi:RNA polymerase sigma-54 factor